jgi:radical SAM superfamily enzyme YgiQ (UPF0313 family)
MDIVIINPPIRLTDKPRHIPHGLAIIANIIKKKIGIVPRFLDLNAHRYSQEETVRRLKEYRSDVILIGGLIPVYKRIIALTEKIKEIKPSSIVIAGGSAAMSVPELLLRKSKVDVVCAGEGEIAIVELLNGLRNNKLKDLLEIKGFYFKIDGEIIFTGQRDLLTDLDSESDLPAYDLLPMDIYLSNPVVGFGRDIDFISSRGCPFECTFCYQPWGRKFRGHSIDFVLTALKHLRNNYNIDFISFQDDEFMLDIRRVREFCKIRNRFFPDLLWSCTGRATIVAHNEELVKIMKDSGCTLISFGFESGCQRILNSMNKIQTIEMMENTINICRKNGLPIPVSFIIGMPGEDEQSCKETLNFCLRNNIPLDSLMFATPYPGTEIFNFALRTNRIARNNLHGYLMKLGDARDFIINLTDFFSDDELINKRKEMMEITRENYEKFITEEEIKDKMKSLFGKLIKKVHFDNKDLEHRVIHGGMGIF